MLKYVARASVAVPFFIALGFALAAITVMLVDRFGHVTAYWAVAGGLALVGAMAAVIVSAREREEEVAEQVADKTDTEEVVGECGCPGHGADADSPAGCAVYLISCNRN